MPPDNAPDPATPDPAWMAAAEAIDWPTEPVTVDGLEGLRVPQGWLPVDLPDGLAAWRGPLPGEGLVVQSIGDAEPGGVARWLDLDLALTGGAPPVLVPDVGEVELLERQAGVPSPSVVDAIGGEEVASAEAVLRLVGDRVEMVRSLALAARRGDRAWKVVLHLSTACPPGTDAEVVAANDHVRARAVLSGLSVATTGSPT